MGERATTNCRCWRLTRNDGRIFAFTDHDVALTFMGDVFRPNEALTARALEQTTGLSVDNSEAMGALSAAGLSEADILAGLFDRALVETWRVNWADVKDRSLLFAGEIGEITRQGGAFTAELRGLSEALNRPLGRLYQKSCRAALGDTECGVDLAARGLVREATILEVEDARIVVDLSAPLVAGWFDNGRLRVLSGEAAGLERVVREDRVETAGRALKVWDGIVGLRPGDRVSLAAGCGRTAEVCLGKFDNLLNFRGFPHLPTEDWLMASPGRPTRT